MPARKSATPAPPDDPWKDLAERLKSSGPVYITARMLDGHKVRGDVTDQFGDWLKLRGDGGEAIWVRIDMIVTWSARPA